LLDARGYPFRATVDFEGDGTIDYTSGYTYSNCRLLRSVTTSLGKSRAEDFTYDADGNLVSRADADGAGTTWDYSCW